MNTILTDDELKAVRQEEIERPNWKFNELRYARAIEAAVLSKLAQQAPVYAFRRRGLNDYCTCTKERYDELSAKPRLFEVSVFYRHPAPQQAEALADSCAAKADRIDRLGEMVQRLQAENAALKHDRQRVAEDWKAVQAALRFYADASDYKAPFTGGMGKLWSDCGTIARSALDRIDAMLAAAPEAPAQSDAAEAVNETNAILASRYFELLKVVENYEKSGVTCQTFRHFVDVPCAECNSAPEAPAQSSEVDERAEFEAWYLRVFDSRFFCESTWRGWQARAALAQKGDAR
ncbi:hypothetical protein [Hydrogenophaga sp.]|uniref:hypothetical protein n=1 Tax=Hydrogenophaga sp. TaxID=1904254 RepID=UPI0035B29102